MLTLSSLSAGRLLRRSVFAFVLACLLWAASSQAQSSSQWPMGIKHVGAVYLDAGKGDLEVELFKKDSADAPRNQGMRAFLSAPDGSIVDEVILPAHDFKGERKKGTWGPTQRHTLRTRADEPGIYTLLVTFEEYRYGEGAVWGFETNAKRYMLDAGGGHKDGLRNERIMLNNPGVPGEICFMPQEGAFRIELSDLPANVKSLTLLDADDKPVEELVVNKGKVATVIAAGSGNRDGVWRLLLPSQQVVAQIEGVTTWKNAEVGTGTLALWTTSRDNFFDLQSWYWLLRPRNLTRVVEKNREASVRYTVYNSGREPIEVSLEARAHGLADKEAAALGLKVTPPTVALDPGHREQVTLSYDSAGVPAQGANVRLYAAAKQEEGDASFKTYATLRLTHEAPARAGITPLVLKPWQHEAQTFGYEPDYPTEGEPYFSPDNTPWIIADQQISYRSKDGKWVALENIPALLNQRHGGKWAYLDTVTGFDKDGAAYFTLRSGGRVALVRVADKGATEESITSVLLPGDQMSAVFMEKPSLFATPDGPPSIYRTIRTSDRPRVPGQRWGRNHRLEVIVPEFKDGTLTVGEPIVVSEVCVGLSNHSGAPNPVISNGDKVHVVWGETSSAEDKHSGVPTYAASWDRSGKPLSEKVLLGYAPPVNDGHNAPGMVMDSKGTLHAVLGSHNQSFQYAHSLAPDSAAAWTKATAVAPKHSQSYVGLVIDRNDVMHLVYREWRREPVFPGVFDAALFYQRKEPGKGWSKPVPLILPPLPHYSVYYHKLSNDRLGRLFLSYDYWSTWMPYRAAERESIIKRPGAGLGVGRALMFSGDGGREWLLAENEDFSAPAGQ